LLRALDDEIERDGMCGETTGIVIVVTPDRLWGASCGDSSAWLVDEHGHADLTEEQRRKLRLGSGRTVPVPFSRAIHDGTLVVGTDGLFDYALPEDICARTRGALAQDAADALIELVRAPSGRFRDDVSVVMVAPRKMPRAIASPCERRAEGGAASGMSPTRSIRQAKRSD